MDSGDMIQIFILIVLLALSAFFSSAETALTTVNKIRMKTLADDGDNQAAVVLKVIDDSGKMLSAILIGNNIVNLSASSLATAFAIRLFGSVGAGIATGILTILILIFGEITPKTLATIHAEKISLTYASVIFFLMKVMTPVIFIVNLISMKLLFLFRVDPSKSKIAMTENELRTILDVGHEDGVIEKEEREMIDNVFDFGDARAKDVMIPRIDVTFLPVESTYEEFLSLYREVHYTRYPVFEHTTDNVIGIVNIKDLILYDDKDHFSIRDILRPVYFTHEFKHTSELLIEMQQISSSFAIVLDEYGSTIGLVSLEDLLEEIVGEIRDEFDFDEEENILRLNEREFIVSGSVKLEEINELLDITLDSDDNDSIAGFIIETLDHIPSVEESITLDNGICFVVEQLDKKRIDKIHIFLPDEEETNAEERNEETEQPESEN